MFSILYVEAKPQEFSALGFSIYLRKLDHNKIAKAHLFFKVFARGVQFHLRPDIVKS